MEDKLIKLCNKITQEGQERLVKDKLNCEANLINAIAHHKAGNKYTKIDVGTSGRYMIDNATGEIYGIKAYGVIHKGHFYGTLDTIDKYYWGNYTAHKLEA